MFLREHPTGSSARRSGRYRGKLLRQQFLKTRPGLYTFAITGGATEVKPRASVLPAIRRHSALASVLLATTTTHLCVTCGKKMYKKILSEFRWHPCRGNKGGLRNPPPVCRGERRPSFTCNFLQPVMPSCRAHCLQRMWGYIGAGTRIRL